MPAVQCINSIENMVCTYTLDLFFAIRSLSKILAWEGESGLVGPRQTQVVAEEEDKNTVSSGVSPRVNNA